MKKIINAFAIPVCLLLVLTSCSKLKKTVPPENMSMNQAKNNTEESGEKANPTPSPAPAPAPKPTPAVTPAPEKKQTAKSGKTTTPAKYKILVDISDQKVKVYKNGSVIRTMICSTGLPGKDTETPVGNFNITKYRGKSFYNNDPAVNEGAKYWVGFIGANFLFHSVPTDRNGNIIQEEATKLGTPASHGCVRLSMDDAKWFYDTIPAGSDVVIQE